MVSKAVRRRFVRQYGDGLRCCILSTLAERCVKVSIFPGHRILANKVNEAARYTELVSHFASVSFRWKLELAVC